MIRSIPKPNRNRHGPTQSRRAGESLFVHSLNEKALSFTRQFRPRTSRHQAGGVLPGMERDSVTFGVQNNNGACKPADLIHVACH